MIEEKQKKYCKIHFTPTYSNWQSPLLSLTRNYVYAAIEGKGPSWPWSYGSWIYNYLCNQYLSPLMLWVRISIRARCTLCDNVYQWLATDRWFSPVTPVSSSNKTDRHCIAEILLKVAFYTINPNPFLSLTRSNLYTAIGGCNID